MDSTTRLVVLGDPHINVCDEDVWLEAVEDINALKPDIVLVVGDLTGYGPEIGTPDAVRKAVAILDRMDAQWLSVLGNHDLEAGMFAHDEDAVSATLVLLKRREPWLCQDVGPLRVIGLSTTQFRANHPFPHEVYFGPEQLDWFAQTLDEKPDRPVLVLAHVPPICSGLITMAELHGSIGHNAFANQNHAPGTIMRMIREHPNILFWFSGHNHLGQHYRDALTVRLGVHFVHTGVIGRHSRDHYRHSRVVDLGADGFRIRTFDHVRRDFDPDLDYVQSAPLARLMEYRHSIRGLRMVPTNPATMYQGLEDGIKNDTAFRP